LQRRHFLSRTGLLLTSRLLEPIPSFASPTSSAQHRLPATDPHYRRVKSYIEDTPVPEYKWASEAAYEAFQDMKYGIRIHWGLYSVAGFEKESWPFLDLNYEERAHYNQIYKTWNPTGFDADEWTSLFAENGLRMFT
jgi:alpha-L-fucosidase